MFYKLKFIEQCDVSHEEFRRINNTDELNRTTIQKINIYNLLMVKFTSSSFKNNLKCPKCPMKMSGFLLYKVLPISKEIVCLSFLNCSTLFLYNLEVDKVDKTIITNTLCKLSSINSFYTCNLNDIFVISNHDLFKIDCYDLNIIDENRKCVLFNNVCFPIKTINILDYLPYSNKECRDVKIGIEFSVDYILVLFSCKLYEVGSKFNHLIFINHVSLNCMNLRYKKIFFL